MQNCKASICKYNFPAMQFSNLIFTQDMITKITFSEKCRLWKKFLVYFTAMFHITYCKTPSFVTHATQQICTHFCLHLFCNMVIFLTTLALFSKTHSCLFIFVNWIRWFGWMYAWSLTRFWIKNKEYTLLRKSQQKVGQGSS